MFSMLVFMCSDPGDTTSKVSCCVETSYCFKNKDFDAIVKVPVAFPLKMSLTQKRKYGKSLCHNYAFTQRFDSYTFTKKQLYTCNIVSKPHCCQGDDYKVGRLQESPLLHLLEDEDGHGDKEQAAQQDGQDGGDHPHDRRTNSPFLSAEWNKVVEGGETDRENVQEERLNALFRVWPGRESLFWLQFSSVQYPGGLRLRRAGYQTAGFPPERRKCRTAARLLFWGRCFRNLDVVRRQNM